MQRIGRARKRPFLFSGLNISCLRALLPGRTKRISGSAVVFSEIHLTGRAKLALPSRIDRKSLRKVMQALVVSRSAIARRIRSDNEMLAGFFVALSSVHSFEAKGRD